jgi:hypothetical protein
MYLVDFIPHFARLSFRVIIHTGNYYLHRKLLFLMVPGGQNVEFIPHFARLPFRVIQLRLQRRVKLLLRREH